MKRLLLLVIFALSTIYSKQIVESIVVFKNDSIDWTKVANSGIRFSYFPIPESYQSEITFNNNIKKAKENGIFYGVYSYFDPTAPIDRQFANFTQHYPISTSYLTPMIIIDDTFFLYKKELRDGLCEFTDMMLNYYKKEPVICHESHERKTNKSIIYIEKGRIKGIPNEVGLIPMNDIESSRLLLF